MKKPINFVVKGHVYAPLNPHEYLEATKRVEVIAATNKCSPSKAWDLFNKNERNPIYTEIYPKFSGDNPYEYLKGEVDTHLYRSVDDLALMTRRDVVQRLETQVSYDFDFWNSISDRIVKARQRLFSHLSSRSAARNG